MYYFNPITGFYHFNKSKAGIAGEEIVFELREMEKQLKLLGVKETVFDKIPFKSLYELADKLMITVKDDEYITFTEKDMGVLKKASYDLTIVFHKINNKDEAVDVFEVSEETVFVNSSIVQGFKLALYSLLSYFNSSLSVGISPRRISDFID